MNRIREATSWGEPVWFSRTDDGVVDIEGEAWPQRIEVTEGFVRAADPRYAQRKGRLLIFAPRNGGALYERPWFSRTRNGITRYRLIHGYVVTRPLHGDSGDGSGS